MKKVICRLWNGLNGVLLALLNTRRRTIQSPLPGPIPPLEDSLQTATQYCYGVASTVGLMAMHIVGYTDGRAVPYAVKLGVALQLTNILRDVAEDWGKGRLYLPLSELAAFNLTESDIAAGRNSRRWQA